MPAGFNPADTRLFMKHTKVVCTIGPSSKDMAVLERLIRVGMNVARLNFSHGSYKDHALLIKNIRQAAAKLGTEVAILQDLQGPRIRIGDLGEEGVKTKKGSLVALVTEKKFKTIKIKNYSIVPIQYKDLYKDVKKGTEILIEDGTIKLVVTKIEPEIIKCKVIVPGVIKTHKGINVPGTSLKVEVITPKDKRDLKFGIEQGVDFVALSFVKSDLDVIKLKKLIDKLEPTSKVKTKVIAKIERAEAIANFDKILAETDGIMVARGDLGIELPAQGVPVLQKEIINKCLISAKPVIVATQMLDSMIRNPQPTRAEVSDVANAVIDHTDAVMLSGETASGSYPVEACRMMSKIIERTEKSKYDDLKCSIFDVLSKPEALGRSICQLAYDLKIRAIVIFSVNGSEARIIARHRIEKPIIVLTNNLKISRQLVLSWGITTKLIEKINKLEYCKIANRFILEQKIGQAGEPIIVVAGRSDKIGVLDFVEVSYLMA